jgi:hypothetical protein
VTRGVAILFAAAALGLGACGGEEEQHGGDATEHSQQKPGTTTPHVAEEDGPGEIGGSHGEAARGPGATDAHDIELELLTEGLQSGKTGAVDFKIADAGGDPITKFEVEHTKEIHLILVSKDLQHFQHVHPKVEGDAWRARVRPQQPGDHRVIADVKHDGKKLALTADLPVEGEPRAVGQPAQVAKLDEQALKAGQPTELRFDAPGEREPYLGAAGHLVILAEDDLEYLHVHPANDELRFQTTFPKPGRYVMFLEHKRDGEVLLSRHEVSVG